MSRGMTITGQTVVDKDFIDKLKNNMREKKR